MSIRHTFQSSLDDSSDATLIQPSHWNADHEFSESSSQLGVFRRKNASGTTYEFTFPTSQIRISADYNFTALSFTGIALTASVTNTVTLTYCPVGINGNNATHYLYIVDAIAGNEAVLITGGTATSGGSGTLTFTPTLSHSAGNWTIISATAGIYEALMSLGATYGKIFIPAGSHNIYAPITITALENFNRVCFEGAGCSNTKLVVDNISTSFTAIFKSVGPHISLAPIYRHFTIEGTQPWGSGRATYTQYPTFFYTQGPCRGIIDDVIISGAWNGIHIESLAAVSDASGWTIINSIIAAYNVGVNVILNYDTIRITNCHFWPWVPTVNYTPTMQYDMVHASCTAIKVRRTDHMVISDCLFYVGTALDIADGGTIDINNTMFDAFSRCSLADTFVAFNNCNFVNNSTIGTFSAHAPSIDWVSGGLSVIGCTFINHSATYPSIKLAGDEAGTHSMVRIIGCQFHQDNVSVNTVATIQIDYASLTYGATAQIIGCAFTRDPSIAYLIAVINVVNGLYVRCVITGNVCAGITTGSSTFANCTADNRHVILNNALNGWGLNYPTTGRVYGVYEEDDNTFQPQNTIYYSGAGPRYTEGGADAVAGTSTLVAGAKTISTTSALTASRIFISPTSAPTGRLYIFSISNGVSFTVKSTDGADVATFNWVIYNNL